MDSLTDTQRDKLTQFKSLINDVRQKSHDDLDLLKWLKARSYDPKKTEAMYRKSMAWRGEIGADDILDTYTPPETLSKYYPGGFAGNDHLGRPIWIDPLGRGDIKGIISSTKKTDVLKFLVYRMEHMYATFKRVSKERGERVDQCVQVIDMEGFGPKIFWKPALDLYSEVLSLLESNYPETLHQTYIIKAPKIFHMGWNILKKFLDKDTASKFRFLDSGHMKTLSGIMDADQMPEYYGGTRRDPDGNPKCEATICYGGDVPKELYKSKDDIFPAGVTRVEHTLGRSGTYTVSFNIPNTQHVVGYVFAVDHGKIDFGVYTPKSGTDNKQNSNKNDVSKMEEVQPIRSVDCSRVPEDGFLFFERPGNYYIHFKNTSRMYKKTLTYVMEIKYPDDMTIKDANIAMTTASQHDSTEL